MTDKMTPEIAIEHIEEILSEVPSYDESLDYELSSYDFDWLEEAKKAVEKQIPEKVKQTFKNDYDLVYCPRCGVRFIQYGKPFCEECGQALDWSERNS